MQKLALVAVVGLVSIAFASPSALAGHCGGVVTEIPAGTETLYIDDRSEGALTINHWIYLESNGQDGLQQGGTAQPELPGFINTDPCDHPNPDTILF